MKMNRNAFLLLIYCIFNDTLFHFFGLVWFLSLLDDLCAYYTQSIITSVVKCQFTFKFSHCAYAFNTHSTFFLHEKMEKTTVFFWSLIENDLVTAVPNYIRNGF